MEGLYNRDLVHIHAVGFEAPARGILIFDVIELGGPSLAGRFWGSGDDWAVLVNTTEHQAARTLVRNIETFRRVDESYRRDRKVQRAPIGHSL
jgi:hypothetical protein